MKHSINGHVLKCEAAGELWVRLEIEAAGIAASASPGQFVQVRAWEGDDPLLRRPFSVAGTDGSNKLLLLIKKRGKATHILAKLAPGAKISVIGPLGNSFSTPSTQEKIFLAAGGIGVAPLRFFVEKKGGSQIQPVLFYGARDSSEIDIIQDPLLKSIRIELTTEDGSAGKKELVTDAIARAVKDDKPDRILTCGPVPMMKEVARIAGDADIPCEVSMETYMGCGIGACMGCAVPAPGNDEKPYLHACMDGPVMQAAKVDWEKI